MYYFSKKEFQKDRIKIVALGLIIGISIGLCAGFLWAMATMQEMIRIGTTQIPQGMRAIPL